MALIPGGAVAWLVGILVTIAAAWFAGRRNSAVDAKAREHDKYKATRKVMDNEDSDINGDDPAAASRFLSERAKRGRRL